MPRRPLPRPSAEASALQLIDTPIFWQTKGAAKLDETQLLPIVGPIDEPFANPNGPGFVYHQPDDTAKLENAAENFPLDETEHRHGASLAGMTFSLDSSTGKLGMIASPNFSSRDGKKVRLLIVHTAEGAKTNASLGGYFANSANQVSSHAGIDDHGIEQFVSYDQAAWTARSANAIADQVELCGFAHWTAETWVNEHHNMLVLTAQWLRERAAARGIPLRKLTPAQVAAGDSGVIAHVDWTVGMKDGTHTDCGTGFPWDYVMSLATGGSAPTPPSPKPEPMQTPTHVLAWTLPAGTGMQETIPIPVFPPFDLTQHAELWMVTGWEDAQITSMYYVRDAGPGRTPEQENWGGTGEWTLAHDDRPGFNLGPDCTSVAVSYSSPRPIQCLIRYP